MSRNTVIAAYDALQAEGYLDAVTGSGTRVAVLPKPGAAARQPQGARAAATLGPRRADGGAAARPTIPGRIAFHPGYPEIASFPFPTWARLLASNMRDAREDLFGYH